MSYGIKTFDKDSYVNLHSDYSSIVYYGEMSRSITGERPIYGPITDSLKDSNYGMGWITQYQISGINTDYVLPFYKPNFSNQKIGILDVIKKDSTTWIVNVIYSGSEGNYPRLFAFAPLTAIPKPTLSGYGIAVYDQSNNLVFTDSKRPLRVDASVLIKHPSTIRTASKGSCSRGGYNCHVNFTPDYFSTYSSTTNATTSLYHIVPSAYGGLAYRNYVDNGSETCDLIFSRKYAWNYQSWASFRGTMSHTFGTGENKANWLADFAGQDYKEETTGCNYGAFFGIVLGGLLVIFTGGGALAFVGGYVVGFALTSVNATPSLKAYTADQVFDTNNSSNLIITDARYYGIDGLVPPTETRELDPWEISYNGTSVEGDYIYNYYYWLDSYDANNNFVSSRVNGDAFDTTYTTYKTSAIATYTEYTLTQQPKFYSRGKLIWTYTDKSKAYALVSKPFSYSIATTSQNTTIPNTHWRVGRSTDIRYDDYYYLSIFYNNLNSTRIYFKKGTTLNEVRNITSVTTGGYTYYRGAPKEPNYFSISQGNYYTYSIGRE